jgi:hypothetical protein
MKVFSLNSPRADQEKNQKEKKEKGKKKHQRDPQLTLNLVFLVMPMQQRIFKGKCSSGSRRGRFLSVLSC